MLIVQLAISASITQNWCLAPLDWLSYILKFRQQPIYYFRPILLLWFSVTIATLQQAFNKYACRYKCMWPLPKIDQNLSTLLIFAYEHKSKSYGQMAKSTQIYGQIKSLSTELDWEAAAYL